MAYNFISDTLSKHPIVGNGFFLYSSESLKKARQAQCGLIESAETDDVENETYEEQVPRPELRPIQPSQFESEDEVQYIIITSLWYWWYGQTSLKLICLMFLQDCFHQLKVISFLYVSYASVFSSTGKRFC